MTIVTLCGNPANDADCSYCLRRRECREVCAGICRGCKREGICPAAFKAKRQEEGYCREGR